MIYDADGYVIGTETCPAPPPPWVLTASMRFTGEPPIYAVSLV
jgi:hypothetical protein